APGAPDAAGNRPKPDAAAPRDTTPVLVKAVKAVLRSLMTARSLNFTYARSSGTLLPGYLPGTTAFGLSNLRGPGIIAPGIPFVIGKQYNLRDLYGYASSNGWYTGSSEFLNTPFSSLLTENLTLRTTLEPFRDFLVQVDARRQKVENKEAYYRNQLDTLTLLAARDPSGNKILDPAQAQALASGSFSTSTITINTLFNDLSANGEVSKAFARFVTNRGFIQSRLAQANPPSVGQPIPATAAGNYSYNSQDVLIPAFIDAYHGRSSGGYQAKKFNIFDQLPLPNWTVNYNGLSQLPFFRDYFTSFTLNHAYSSSYNVGSYTSSTLYNNNDLDFPTRASATGQYIPYYVIGQVSIVERLSPLIGVNFQTLNKVTGRVEYRTDRQLGLNTTNAQVTELHTTALVIGFGYVTAGLKLPFRVGGEQRVLKNTLNVKLDLSINDNTIIQRSIVNVVDPADATASVAANVGTPSSQIVNGARTFQLRPTVDYLLNTRLNLQFYYTQTITTPRVSNAFRNATTEGGLLLRYSLTQ
ncbi:cell surface protein SprA, partial [Hymenobacter coccineus]